jgi:SpoVK/Ycf46/Vps4 family AAA+-type ATPase
MDAKKLIPAIKAGYSYFYCQSYEINRTVQEIKDIAGEYKNGGDESIYKVSTWDFETVPDPEEAVNFLSSAKPYSILIAKNFNWFLIDNMEGFSKSIVTFLQNHIEEFSSAEFRKVLIIVSDAEFDNAIPSQLTRDFLPLEFPLPRINEVSEIYDFVIDSVKDNPKFQMPDEDERKNIILNSRGMTKREIVNALSFSIVSDGGKLLPKTVAGIRNQGIEKNAGIKIGRYPETFKDLKGYENIKEFARATIMGPRRDLAKGLLLTGPPGTGKTMFCRCTGNETGLEVLEVEVAQLFGKYVGESEKNFGNLIKIAVATAPCIVFMDEIDKALAGIGGGDNGNGTPGASDSVSRRSAGQFLKFMQQRPEGVYVFATCNSINIPPEWIRAERWDCAPFYVGLPQEEEREAILKYYQKVFDVKGKPSGMEGWSGAEIKSVCRIAAMMGRPINEVEQFVIPVSKTMGDQIGRLEKWAEGKTIPASTKVPIRQVKGQKRSIAL